MFKHAEIPAWCPKVGQFLPTEPHFSSVVTSILAEAFSFVKSGC